MKLNQIKINSFRDIPELNLEFDSNLKVIVGANDKIRTNILDAIAIGISDLFCGFNDFKPLPVKTIDSYFNYPTAIKCNVLIEDKKINYTRELKRKQNKSLLVFSRNIQNQISEGKDCNLPLLAYYRAERKPIIANKEFITRFKPCSQMVGYKDCFNSPNGKMISSWFHSMQMDEYYKKTTINLLEYFREVLKDVGLPTNPYEENQTRCCQYLLSIVADLAYRSAVLNPFNHPSDIKTLGDCANGIVLIDAVELNLDLTWQRQIMPHLAYTFPKLQFIITTDSPLVLSTTKTENIICLEANYSPENHYTLSTKIPEVSYGQTSDRILENVMDTPARPQRIKDKILYIFRKIEEGDIDEAIAKRDTVSELIGFDPELTKIDVLIHKKKQAIKITS
jgi:predicted ATP-binding protein involved in virulence